MAIINGDTADIVKDNNLGLCANPSSVNAIIQAFQKCIDMSQSEREFFTSKNDYLLATIFNKEKTMDKLLEILTRRIE